MALVISAIAHAALFVGLLERTGEWAAPVADAPSPIEARLIMPDRPADARTATQARAPVAVAEARPPVPDAGSRAAAASAAGSRASQDVAGRGTPPAVSAPRPRAEAANPDAAPAAAPLAAPVPAVPDPALRQPTLPPAPDYRLSGTLSPPPRIVDAPEPVYPAGAENEEGTVVLRILISAGGTIDDVAVARSLPPGLFDESALAVFRAARVTPGYLMGVPVKSQITLELKYTPVNRGSSVSGSTAGGLRGPALSRPAP